jgi:hypothetical protein
MNRNDVWSVAIHHVENTGNVPQRTIRRVLAAIDAVKINKYFIVWVGVYSIRFPASNAHAPYCLLWPVRFYHVFPNCLINRTIFEKSEAIFILRGTERYMITYVYRSSCTVPVILVSF